jgi:hypothetical protein
MSITAFGGLYASGSGIYRGVKADKKSSTGKKVGKALLLGGGYEGYEISKTRNRGKGTFGNMVGAGLFGSPYTSYQKGRKSGSGVLVSLARGALTPYSTVVTDARDAYYNRNNGRNNSGPIRRSNRRNKSMAKSRR